MSTVQFVKQGHKTNAFVAGQLVGFWEPAGLQSMLSCRWGWILRPQRDDKFDVVDTNNWAKKEWKSLIIEFAKRDQKYRKTFWRDVIS